MKLELTDSHVFYSYIPINNEVCSYYGKLFINRKRVVIEQIEIHLSKIDD
jgi:hypothetical protein